MGISRYPNLPPNLALSQYFGWAGRSYPYNNETDIVISSNTTWSDAVGYKKVRKLTIAAGVILTIAKSPFVIFADEIVFGDAASIIDGSGPAGAASGTFATTYARGGTIVGGSARAQGGCGGIMLFILANTISGANGIIKANGGDGFRNTTNAGVNSQAGGQGSLSSSFDVGTGGGLELFAGTSVLTTATNKTYLHPQGRMLGDGGGGGTGGGSGINGGGSGIGGGGSGAAATNGGSPFNTIRPDALNELAFLGCLGGGGGGASVNTTGTNNAAGGGGGGSIVVWSKFFNAIPTLQANGGAAVGTAGAGAPGVAYLISI